MHENYSYRDFDSSATGFWSLVEQSNARKFSISRDFEMALNLEAKQAIVSDVNAVAKSAHSAIAAHYHGLNVEEMTELHKLARQHDVYLRVVKNTLAKRAVENTDFECMQQGLSGPLVLAFSKDDPASAARLFKEFSDTREEKEVEIKMVAMGGKLLDASAFEKLASLPSYEVAVSMLMGVMQAPMAKFLRTLKEVPAKFVRVVVAVKDHKRSV